MTSTMPQTTPPQTTPPPIRPRTPLQAAGLAARFIPGIFGLVFGGVGVTVIVSLWTADGYGEPPT
jgi:hypothetical protein